MYFMNNRLRRNIGFVAFGMGLCGLLGCASTKPVKQTQPTSFISGSEGTHLQDDNSSTVQQSLEQDLSLYPWLDRGGTSGARTAYNSATKSGASPIAVFVSHRI